MLNSLAKVLSVAVEYLTWMCVWRCTVCYPGGWGRFWHIANLHSSTNTMSRYILCQEQEQNLSFARPTQDWLQAHNFDIHAYLSSEYFKLTLHFQKLLLHKLSALIAMVKIIASIVTII